MISNAAVPMCSFREKSSRYEACIVSIVLSIKSSRVYLIIEKREGQHIINIYMYELETMKDLDEGCYMNYAYYQYKHTFVMGIVTQVLIGIPIIC